MGQRMVLIRPDRSFLNFRFLRYWLNSPFVRDFIQGRREGSGAPRINMPTIRELLVPTAPLDEQNAVACLLGALDDKVAVNERIATAASNLGVEKFRLMSLSVGREVYVGDVIDLKYGKSLPAARRIAGGVPVFGSGGISGTHNVALVEGPGIIVGRKGTVGTIYWSQVDFFPIDTTFFVARKGGSVSLEFMYFALRSLRLERMNSDSAVPGLNRDRAHSLTVRLPTEEEMQNFTMDVRSLFQLQQSREGENQKLVSLRDALLPHLMSGRLRVKDAEKIVEDHV